jgi:hypothetical protein
MEGEFCVEETGTERTAKGSESSERQGFRAELGMTTILMTAISMASILLFTMHPICGQEM